MQFDCFKVDKNVTPFLGVELAIIVPLTFEIYGYP